MSARIGVVGGAVVLACAVIGVPAPAGALSDGDAGCRAAMGARVGRYANVLLHETEGCHALRMRGLLPEVLACEDRSAWEASGFRSGTRRVERAYDHMLSEIAAGCAGASLPAELGFTACPSPCAGAVASYADVGSCLACLTEAAVGGLVRGTYGVPPLVSAAGKAALSCQRRIGRAADILLRARLILSRVCQTRKDRGEAAASDCRAVENPEHPSSEVFGRITATAERNIEKCGSRDGVDIGATLDSCGTDVPTEQACVKTAAAATGNALFAYVYATAGQPTPTPASSSPTVTETPTPLPTCAPTGTPPPFPSCGAGEVVACIPPFGMCADVCEPCRYARPDCPSVTCTQCRCCHCGTPTPPADATPTPTACGAAAPTINPVDSPTTLLEQVIVGVGRVTGARVMSFSSPAGCTGPTPVSFGSTYSALCQLLPRQSNRIDVCIHNQLCGGSACSSAWIVHADPTTTPPPPADTPTPTPT